MRNRDEDFLFFVPAPRRVVFVRARQLAAVVRDVSDTIPHDNETLKVALVLGEPLLERLRFWVGRKS
jgi:hypothetical protein